MRRIEVRLDWGDEQRSVGSLAGFGRRILFEYSDKFLADPLPLSPFHLPVRPGLFEEPDRVFDGLHGLFNDSLPDGWGLLLMDRHLRQLGLDVARISPLDRLAWLHTRGMGALTFHPASNSPDDSVQLLDLTQLAREAESVYRGDAKEVLPQLRLAGGSPGGARPKVIVGFNPQARELISGTAQLPSGFNHYIIKFNAEEDGPEAGAIELAYSLMAAEAGINMKESRLFHTEDGRRYFGTERFDRKDNERIHMHTLGGLLHASHRHPSLGYDGYLKATRVLTRDRRQLLQAYRRMAFNVLAHNRDDHVKNFAFLMSRTGEWRLAPAYDLVYSTGINGWHTMDVAGEAQSPGRSDMLRVADSVGVTLHEANAIINEVAEAVALWPEFADMAGLSRQTTDTIQHVLTQELH